MAKKKSKKKHKKIIPAINNSRSKKTEDGFIRKLTTNPTKVTIRNNRHVIVILLVLVSVVLIYVIFILITKVNQIKNEITPQNGLLQVETSVGEDLVPNTLNPQQTSPTSQNLENSTDQLLPQKPSGQQQQSEIPY